MTDPALRERESQEEAAIQAGNLVATDLVKIYRRRRVVNNISLIDKRGEIVGLLVPNGAGKTTTFYMIVGLNRPDECELFLDGKDITSQLMDHRARGGIHIPPQEPSIF